MEKIVTFREQISNLAVLAYLDMNVPASHDLSWPEKSSIANRIYVRFEKTLVI
jgi:hypothetical protein